MFISRRLLVALSIGLIAVAVWRNAWRSAPPPAATGPGPLQSVAQLRTSVYSHDTLMLRVSAGAVTMRRPRLLGPFRLGVLRSVEARDLTIETFAESHGQQTPTSSLVKQAVTALLPERLRKTIVRAEVELVELIQHAGDGTALRFTANHCNSAFGRDELVCTRGVVHRGTTEIAFRQAEFDAAGHCRLDGLPCP